jgi:sugar lactone lactonase YvrE
MVYVIAVSLPLWAYIPTQELINGYRGFEPNYGQVQDFEGKPVKDIIFSTKAPGLHLFFKKDGVSYVIYSKTNEELNSFEGFDLKERLNKEDSSPLNYSRVDLELVGGSIDNSRIVFEDELPGYVNYYLSSCPEGITNLKTYRVVRVKDVYPGIDWVFRYDADGNLHHEFVVKPEGNPDEIRLKVKWADVKLSDDGSEIILSTPVGDILDGSIYAYEGDKRVKVNYVFDGGLLAYDVRGWSRNENLVIDPPLARLWATYYGGSSSDYAYSVATDQQGNVYVVGRTGSIDFPVYNPGDGAYYQGSYVANSDAFILKFNSIGARLWATYYGGGGYDYANSVAIDPQGNVYVVGYTYSTGFPVYNPGGGTYYQGSNAGYDDAFILKFNSSGVRLWATYYGGSDYDRANSVAIDPQGNVYVVGYTLSTNFPVYDPGGGTYYQGINAGYYDAFILKFNSSGVRQWATYYGGSDFDRANSVAIEPQGNVYVVGYTLSTDFPVYDPGGGTYYQGTIGSIDSFDVFILKFDSSGVRLWATYYGGSDYDIAHSVAIDPQGNVYVVGQTYFTGFPVYNPGGGAYYQGINAGYSDAFILKFNSNGVRQWATYYGGSDYDYAYSVTTDPQGNVYVVGYTSSIDFPVYDPGGGAYYQGSNAGGYDAFILKFNSNGVRLWATYYGGSSSDDYAYSVATDPQGNVYVVGYTSSIDFPVYDPGGGAYYQGSNAGGYDVFILKFEGIAPIDEPRGKDWVRFSFKSGTLILLLGSSADCEAILSIYDASGRPIYGPIARRLSSGETKLEIKVPASGVYFYRVETPYLREKGKVVIVR